MKRIARPLLLLTLVAVLPVLLVVPLEPVLSDWPDRLDAASASPTWLLLLVVGLLASDIVLPVPSAPLITLASAQLGFVPTAIAAWLGLMIGSLAAFALTYRYGEPIARRLGKPEELDALRQAMNQYDVWLLLLSRPLPVIAEAAVLLAGLLRVQWPRAVAYLSVGNAVVAIVFSLLGSLAKSNEWLAVAIVLSIALPIAFGHQWYARLKQADEIPRQ